MPRNVRNFWIKGQIDGVENNVEFGPKTKEGGFSLTVSMRDKGEICVPITIVGRAEDGKLTLNLSFGDDFGWELVTER